VTIAIYRWIDSVVFASKEYLKDPTKSKSEDLRIHFEKIYSLREGYGYSLRQVYGYLSNRREQTLVSIALWSIGNKKDSRSVMNPDNPLNPSDHEFEQLQVYGVLRKFGFGAEICLPIVKDFKKSTDEISAGVLTQAIMRDLPNFASDEHALDVLMMNICAQTPLEILVENIHPVSDIPWKKLLGWIFEKFNFDKLAFEEALANKVPSEVIEIFVNETMSIKGDFIATKFLANSTNMTDGSSFLKLIPLSDSRKMAILKKLLANGYHDEKYIREYLQMPTTLVESAVLSSIATAYVYDKETRKILIESLERMGMTQAIVSRCQEIGFENLNEFEIATCYQSLKILKNYEGIFELIKIRVINDPLYLIRRLSGNIFLTWEVTFEIFEQQLEFAEPSTRCVLIEVFTKGVTDEQLMCVYAKYPMLPPQVLHRVATCKLDNQDNDEAQKLLIDNIEKKYSPSAALYLDMFPSGLIGQDLLELAAESSPKYRKMFAIELIKSDGREKAANLLASIAHTDDEAAHILIHILGVNVAFWSDILYLREQSFTSDRFEKLFQVNGLKKLPSSELETTKLHQIKIAKKLGISKRKINSGNFELESWPCNLALIHPISDDWSSSSCAIHRPDVQRFENLELLKPLNSDFWSDKKMVLKSNSAPFKMDRGTYVLKNVNNQSLRKWQEEALRSWALHGRQGIIEAATGSGKSRVGALAALEAIDDGFAVLIVVPNRILQQQWIKDYFRQFWGSRELPIRTMGNEDSRSEGFINPTRTLVPGTITVAVVNTASSIERDFRQDSDTRVLLIVDEVHNFSSDRNRKILSDKFERRLGLTATLEVPTGKYPVISNYFAGHPIYEYEFSRAVEEQVISSYDLLMIRVPLSDAELQGYRIAYQEMISFKEKLLLQPGPREGSLSFDRLLRFFKSTQQHSDLIAKYEKAFEDSDRFLRDSDSKAKSIRSVASVIKSRGYALVFCDLNTTCENVGIILTNQGVKSQILNQSVPQQDREKYFSQFENGSIQALIAPKVLDEGIDIRLASIGIFAGTSRKKLQTIQRLGRVLRKHPDKHKPLIILPVGIGTEEDPKVQGNEDLAESTYVDVYSRADIRKCFDNSQQLEIQEFLAQRC